MGENNKFESNMLNAHKLKDKVFSYARVRARRLYLITLIFLLQFAFYIYLLFTLQSNIFRYLSIANIVFIAAFALFIMTRKLTTSYKLSWLVIGAIAPIFTWLFYLFTTNSFISKRSLLTRIFHLEQCFVRFFHPYALQSLENFKKTYLTQEKLKAPESQALSNFYALAKLVSQYNGSPLYPQQDLTYFASGESAWPAIKQDLLNARKQVFIEYYIVKNGVMLDECLDILTVLLQRGVSVYFMFDGACELALDFNLAQTLRNSGAKATVFMPISTKFTMDHNHRDHRKLIIIDDLIAYTGGINLADEYINLKSPFGYWKDAVIRVKGSAVMRMKAFFITSYASAANLKAKEIKALFNSDAGSSQLPEFKQLQVLKQATEKPTFSKKTLSTKQIDSSNDMPHSANFAQTQSAVTLPKSDKKVAKTVADNFLLPYADAPSAGNSFSENLYIQALYNAKEQCCIMTPYLILSDELLRALVSTATRGVEVMIILPGIPDKKAPFALARSHYSTLLSAGIKLYEFTAGFTHAKLLVVDKQISFVGTVNFDYRSLYLNFENGIIAYDPKLANEISADFAACLQKCELISESSIQAQNTWQKLLGIIIRPFGPLL